MYKILIPLLNKIINLSNYVLSQLQTKSLKKCGANTFLGLRTKILGHKQIIIGNNVRIGDYSIITAWESYLGFRYNPEIIIEEGTTIGEFAHITAINKIIICKNVMIGKFVTISDNSHGNTSQIKELELTQNPKERELHCKGPVIIGKNVWIGDKTTILSNVTIGESSIVGANSVVTKNVPPFCVFAGNPAKKIKDLR